ncbi:AAA family ATPase [Amnibacterium sp. CER49]|uniref:helix-turn-helix transcriptional regulator n=1 Tax=Amnibacterium sp. CER49 TaxID=3039161 RepID=UPI00244C55CA|nr:AAA family ATPase [Amnibacterium sp. CER49]MDH2444510.1 AAA family ATPase [Amnibacterium sp. CER49]
MALLERQVPMEALNDAAGDARAGAGRLVLLAGEAGAGKTALLERFRRAVPDAVWSEGACDGLTTPLPLGPLYEVAAQLGGDLGELIRRSPARIDLFATLLRRLEDPRTFDVVVLEDLHWADEATVDLLRYVARRIRSARSLVVVTYRSDELAERHPLRLALGELVVRQSTRRIELQPLSAEAVARLAHLAGVDGGELHAVTGGNPFFVTEVLRSGLTTLPPSARDLVLGRALRLGPAASTALETAALMGRVIEVATLQAVTGADGDVLAELLEVGLLVDAGGVLTFRHEIARRAVEEAIPPHRRVAIHRRLLDALLAQGSTDATLLAFHAAAAGDDPVVLEQAPRAADAALRLRSHREAATHLERAVAAAAVLHDPREAALCDALGLELATIDRVEEAERMRRRALALWHARGEPYREGDTLRHLSRVLWRLARSDEAVEAAEGAIRILEPLGPSVELAWATAALAGHRMVHGGNEAAIDLARRAESLAERFDLPAVLSDALNAEACALANEERPWEPVMRRALDVAVGIGTEDQAARAYANLAWLLCAEYRFEDARPVLAEATAYCEGRDLETYGTVIRGLRALVALRRGRWNDAAAIADHVLRTAGASPINRMTPLLVLGLIAARRGDDDAWRHLDEALAIARGSDEPDRLIDVRLARAEACWLERRVPQARQEVGAIVPLIRGSSSWLAGAVAVWCRRLELPVPAGAVAEPFALELRGRFTDAAGIWFDRRCRYLAALSLLGSDGEADLRRALEVLHELDAVAAQRIARERLRGIGARAIPTGARGAAREHPAGLTAREQEVLAELRAGRTNAEIAARLVISMKTVDHHVTSVFAKLGVHSREEAALMGEPAALGDQVRPGF